MVSPSTVDTHDVGAFKIANAKNTPIAMRVISAIICSKFWGIKSKQLEIQAVSAIKGSADSHFSMQVKIAGPVLYMFSGTMSFASVT